MVKRGEEAVDVTGVRPRRRKPETPPPAGQPSPSVTKASLDNECTIAELLWRLYADNREYARSHEAQRAAAASLIIAISAGLVGLATSDQKLGATDLPLTLFLLAVGVFGVVFSSKHYERTRLHLNRAKQYLGRLDELFPGEGVVRLQEQGDAANREMFPRLSKVKLNTLWNSFYLAISVLGAFLSGLIFVRTWF